jgi:hypothetical protein
MSPKNMDAQEREWLHLYDTISELLQRLVVDGACEHGDYHLLDENWGRYRHELEIGNLVLLKPEVVRSLQALLSGLPDWEISVGIDVVSKYTEWPPMGIVVRDDEIVDGLQRQYLPAEYQAMRYEGRTRELGPLLPR